MTNFLVLLNSHHEDVAFTLPAFPARLALDRLDGYFTRRAACVPRETYDAGTAYPLQARSMVVLMERRGQTARRKSRMKRRHNMPFGAECRDDGSVRFRLWAPSAPQRRCFRGDGHRQPLALDAAR